MQGLHSLGRDLVVDVKLGREIHRGYGGNHCISGYSGWIIWVSPYNGNFHGARGDWMGRESYMCLGPVGHFLFTSDKSTATQAQNPC